MARTELSVQAITLASELEDLTWTAASATNDHYFLNTGGEVLLVKNGDGSSHDIVIDSIADRYGRVNDVTISTGAGENSAMGFFAPEAFNQAGSDVGRVHIDIGVDEDANMYLAVIRPANWR